MTLSEWASAWWYGEAVPQRRAPAIAVARVKPRVPAEYLSLYTYLEHRYASMVVLTFDQMEALLGFSLPEPARTEPEWWTGAPVRASRHSDAWTVSGRVATPNLPARNVAFERRSSPQS